ncbi:hypothetical protein JNUCC64_03505 [Streptomyces sp. JNUCC 64]
MRAGRGLARLLRRSARTQDRLADRLDPAPPAPSGPPEPSEPPEPSASSGPSGPLPSPQAPPSTTEPDVPGDSDTPGSPTSPANPTTHSDRSDGDSDSDSDSDRNDGRDRARHVTEAGEGDGDGGGAGDRRSPDRAADNTGVARAVLAVADRLTNRELVRRLYEAVGGLDGIDAVRPAPGDAFDPLAHRWSETREAPRPQDRERVAEVLVPGFTGPDGTVLRPARVVVYDIEGD